MDQPALTVAVSIEQQVRAHETPWERLDAASLLRVYYKLESKEVASCSCVCRSWREVGQTSKLWKDLLVKEVGCPLRQYDVSNTEENYRQMLVDAKTARLWSWGANMLKLTGISADSIHLPTEVFLHAIEVGPSVSGIAFSAESHAELRNLPAREVSCAEDFAVILTWEGQVIDSRGSLANNAPWRHQGRSMAPLSEWPFSQEANQVVAVAAGGTWSGHDVSGGHAAAITSDGSLWVWGGNTQGQLGLGEQSQAWVSSPRKVRQLGRDATPAPAAAVACGTSHTAVLLADGSLWVAGCNHLGCCGLPETVQEVHTFTEVDLGGRRCCQLAAGDHNCAILTSSGRVMVCGSNQSAQCGMPSVIPCSHAFLDLGPNAGWHGAVWTPNKTFEVVGVACGSGSMYALEKGGSAFAWGGGSHGELGIGAMTRAVATPSRMLWAHDVEYVTGSAGGRFGGAVDSQGRLFTFGNGRAGQLGQGDTSKRCVGRVVKTLQPVVVRRAAAGACFSMAISSWRCPSTVTPPETPEPIANPSFLSPTQAVSSVFKDVEDSSDTSSTHFSSLSLRPSLGLGHLHSLRRNSSAASWASDCSDGMSMYTSSPGDTEDDEEDDEDFLADEAPDVDLGRREIGSRSSSFPGAVNRLTVQGQCHRFMGVAGGSVDNLESAISIAEHQGQAQATSDRQLRRDLRRQLRAFMQEAGKRELLFPTTLNSAERHQVHVIAEAWGLCHQSRGQGPERQLAVWKPSKPIRRSPSALAAQAELAPPLLERDEDMDHGSDVDLPQ